ncbi:MAG TPA: hypothetical protein VGL81_14760 [Polyangiaceae bacterium]|jgi:hypothetical protein
MPASPVDSEWRQSSPRYHLAVLTHYGALFPLLFGVGLAAVSVTLALAVALTAELALVGFLPRLVAFRRSVDQRHQRIAAVAARTEALGLMSAYRRGELEQLERLAADIRARCDGRRPQKAGTSRGTVDRWLGLDRLLALFVDLAITHRANEEVFRAKDWATLEAQYTELNLLARATHGSNDVWIERRRAVLERRRETWRHAAAECELIAQELATIGDVVRWMYELCALNRGDAARCEVEDVLASWEENGATLREVSALRHVDEHTVDPHLLALGREVMAAMPGAPVPTKTPEPSPAAAGRLHEHVDPVRA